LGVSFLLWRTRAVLKKGGFEDLLGHEALVVSLDVDSRISGYIELRGETWKFESQVELSLNDKVKVIGYRGLILNVTRS